MTTPPVDFDTVLTLARQLPTADQTRLAATLAAAVEDVATSPDAASGIGSLDPTVRRMLANATIDDFVVPPHGMPEDARALLQAWTEEDADDEEGEPWDDVLRSLDAQRFSSRRLFPELDDA